MQGCLIERLEKHRPVNRNSRSVTRPLVIHPPTAGLGLWGFSLFQIPEPDGGTGISALNTSLPGLPCTDRGIPFNSILIVNVSEV